MLYQINLVI
jgi:hypothetical protein